MLNSASKLAQAASAGTLNAAQGQLKLCVKAVNDGMGMAESALTKKTEEFCSKNGLYRAL